MLSTSFDICEFIDKVKGHNDDEIIYFADQEATEAERHLYKRAKVENCDNARSYVVQLKDIVLFMRYGIRTHALRRLDLRLLSTFGGHC